jgi:hypothetical protein
MWFDFFAQPGIIRNKQVKIKNTGQPFSGIISFASICVIKTYPT